MLSSRLFWKLLLTYVGLHAIAAIVGGVFVSHWLRSALNQQVRIEYWVWILVAADCLCFLALSYWILGQIVRPVSTLNEAAEMLAAGDYQHRAFVPSRDELGALAATLNRLSKDLDARTIQLSQTISRQATVLGGMVEGVVAVDQRFRIVLANESAGRLLEFRPAAAEGRPLLEVVRNHSLHAVVKTVLASGQAQRFESIPVGLHAPCFVFHVQPLPGEPCPGVVLVIHDTTELRRLESIRREFVANVSHELKTPLSSIKAYTETLRNGALSDPEVSTRFLARIEEQTERLAQLITDMLMLARIESHHQVFEIISLDVAEMVLQCIEDRRGAADAKRIVLEWTANGAKPETTVAPALNPHFQANQDRQAATVCRVMADREGLREILDNLLDNAIKYTPEEGTVSIAWRTIGSIVEIAVRDTGIGIKPQDQERIFERFYRVDKARSRELGGTGLGLAIVKHLAQAMNGSVSVLSEVGKGSTFTVELPIG